MLTRSSRNKGFTLIELLVVISIVGILSAVAMTYLQSGRQKALDAQISSDLTQVRTALELYAGANGYTYPLVSDLALSGAQIASDEDSHEERPESVPRKIYKKFTSLFGSRAYAAGRNQNCVYFDNLASVLAPYISSLPKHPLDDGGDVCYKYFSSDSGDMAVAYGSMVTEKYSDGTNKQIGIAVGRTDTESLQSLCNANLSSGSLVNGVASPFPLFSGGGDKCSGVIADRVMGVADGEGDVTFAYSCSIGGYQTEEECIQDRSYCSDSMYSNDRWSCEASGSSIPGTCSGGSQYTDYSSCTGAGYSDSGYCSNSSYGDESSCTSAGYSSGGGCSDSNYYDQSSCENAGYSTPGYCSNSMYYDESSCIGAGHYEMGGCSAGGYYDQYSCENAGYASGASYCSDWQYSDEYNCTMNGNTWYPEQWITYGYTWSGGGWVSDGNSWYGGGWMTYGYTWSDPSWYSYGYTWNSGSWYSYNYTWTDGYYTQNTWTSVPGGVWGSY